MTTAAPPPPAAADLLTAEHRRTWEEDGWCVLERALPEDVLASADRALAKLFPGPEEMAQIQPGDQRAVWLQQDPPWVEFPFHSRTLNGIAVGDLMIDLARVLLGVDDVRMYLADVAVKYAGQPSGFNQLLHADFPNHTLTVPRPETGYHQMETFVYLNDVDAGNGATRFVSLKETAHVPVEEHTLNVTDYGHLYDDRGIATAPAGSIVVYRPDTYHRSADFDDPARVRYMMHVSYKSSNMEWGGFHAWPYKGFSFDWHNFVAWATPRQLEVVGFPAPGHPFWTEETIDGVRRRYPGLDVGPWLEALRSGAPPGG